MLDASVMVMGVDTGLRVLVLDDEEYRHAWFQEQAAIHHWELVQAWDAAEGVAALKSNPRFNLVFLDFDLGVYETVGEHRCVVRAGPNGLVVARHLAHLLPLGERPGHVHIHSWNPEGARDMEAVLKAAGMKVSRHEFGRLTLVAREVAA